MRRHKKVYGKYFLQSRSFVCRGAGLTTSTCQHTANATHTCNVGVVGREKLIARCFETAPPPPPPTPPPPPVCSSSHGMISLGTMSSGRRKRRNRPRPRTAPILRANVSHKLVSVTCSGFTVMNRSGADVISRVSGRSAFRVTTLPASRNMRERSPHNRLFGEAAAQ